MDIDERENLSKNELEIIPPDKILNNKTIKRSNSYKQYFGINNCLIIFGVVFIYLLLFITRYYILSPIEIDKKYRNINPHDRSYIYIPIVGTNDIHGHFFPVVNKIKLNSTKIITYKTGGVELIYSYVNILKEEFGSNRVLYFDAGDHYFGAQDSKLFEGRNFEDFFNYVGLNGTTIGNNDFSGDLEDAIKKDEPNFHEYVSAIVAYKEFKLGLDRLGFDAELVARMITGVFYNKQRESHQIHNCLITLLHGKIIDADRLDYACRDVWASGYSTSSVDLRRLISALHIRKCEGDYNVCFESSSLNEIEGVLNVKDFQMKYVINHHVVNYEQNLLVEAAKYGAKYFFSKTANHHRDDPGEAAIRKVVNIKALCDEVQTERGGLMLKNISDDDIIFLMKQAPNNVYYQQWSSRQFVHFSLWKSRDEFYHFFPNVIKDESLKNNRFEEEVRRILHQQGYNDDEILVTEARFKSRVQPHQLYLVVANDVVRYTEIKPNEINSNKDVVFYYVFVSKRNETDREEIKRIRMNLINKLKPTINALYHQRESCLLKKKIQRLWFYKMFCGSKNR